MGTAAITILLTGLALHAGPVRADGVEPQLPDCSARGCHTQLGPDGLPHCVNCPMSDPVHAQIIHECRLSLVLTARGLVMVDGSTGSKRTVSGADEVALEIGTYPYLQECGQPGFELPLFADDARRAQAAKLREALKKEGLAAKAAELRDLSEPRESVFRSRAELGRFAPDVPADFPFDKSMLVLGWQRLPAKVQCGAQTLGNGEAPPRLERARPDGTPIVDGIEGIQPPFDQVETSAKPSTCATVAASLGKSCPCKQERVRALVRVPWTDLPVRYTADAD